MTKSIPAIFLICTLLHVQPAFSQHEIVFSEKGLQLALSKAKAENKPVLLWCYTTWCPHCKFMKENVFINKKVAEYFNNTFICVSLDMEKGNGVELNKELKIKSFPTFIFYDSTGKLIYRIEGELTSEALIQEGKNALTTKKQLPFLKHLFETDVSNSMNCYSYLRALKKGGMDYSEPVRQYFATLSDSQLLSELNWRIISNGISDINSREMQFVIHHQKEYATIASPERVKRRLDYLVKELLTPSAETNDTATYRLKRKKAQEIHLFSTDSLIFTFDLRIWESTKNRSEYSKVCMQSTKIFAWNNKSQLNDIAGNFLRSVSDANALSEAVKWTLRSLDLAKEYDTYLLCSRLYQKLHNLPEAIRMAEKGKELSANYGWEGVEAEKLLNELKIQKN
jgi:thioredoxin-related protein